MGLFGRGNERRAGAAAGAAPQHPVVDESLIDESGLGPLRPRDRRCGPAEEDPIASGLEALTAAGVDVGDLESLGAGFDRDLLEWKDISRRKRPDHAGIVEMYAVGIGEHLSRTTDLRWRVVTDVFGTDLAVTDQVEGDFVVVPHNLVAARWMRGEAGWLPGVVRHLIGVRASAAPDAHA